MAVSVQELKVLPAFSRLSSLTIEHLALATSPLPFKAGFKFFQQGDPPTGLFSLVSGQVKLYRNSKERVQILYVIHEGATFGAESLPNDTPSPCAAQALTSGAALYVPPDALHKLLLEHPDLLFMQLELVTKQLRQFTSLVHSLAFRDVSARLAETLLKLRSYPTRDGFCIEKTFSQQDLAAMVGTAREVICRTMKKFEKEGLVRTERGSIILRDLSRLKEMANQEIR